jgi:K+-transporting ATPase A subunit
MNDPSEIGMMIGRLPHFGVKIGQREILAAVEIELTVNPIVNFL